jgi:hypothetical protein
MSVKISLINTGFVLLSTKEYPAVQDDSFSLILNLQTGFNSIKKEIVCKFNDVGIKCC